MNRSALLVAVAYVGSVVAANVLTDHLGLVPIGFGLMVTAGTFAAGATLLARNIGQDLVGRRAILALMAVGVAVSAWLASPALAVASAVAFSLSELADMLVYSKLRGRGWKRAAIAAGAVGAVIDTLAFLNVAGFPVTVDSVAGQVIVKLGVTVAALGALSARRRRLA